MIQNHPSWSPFTQYAGLDRTSLDVSLDAIPQPRSGSPGPDILSQSNGVVNVKNYVAYFSNGNFYIRAENKTIDNWDEPILLGSIMEVPNAISLAFDQLGRPQIFYESNGKIKLFGYDPTSQTITSRFICNGTTPVAAMDYPKDTSRASCDINVCYVVNNLAKFRIQREKYEIEYSVSDVSPGDDLKLIEVGFRRDRRFGLNFTYKPKSNGGGGTPPDEPGDYEIGTWKFNDARGDGFWSFSEVDPKTSGIVWDNGEAQASMILGLNINGNIPGQTTLAGNTWSAVIPNDPEYGPYVWIGVGFGMYGNRTDPAKGFGDYYDVYFEFACNGKLVKLKVQFDPLDAYYGYGIFLCDNVTNVPADQAMTPAVFGEWRKFNDQSTSQFLPGAYETERYSLNLWMDEFANTWFPNDFATHSDMKQLGEFEATVRAIHKAGTQPNIVGKMKFVITGAT